MEQNGIHLFYHRTTAANALYVKENGFSNSSGHFRGNRTWTGVWLSSRPPADSAGDTLLVVQLSIPDDELAQWEFTTEGGFCREWLIPANIINRCAEKVAPVAAPDSSPEDDQDSSTNPTETLLHRSLSQV